MDGFIQFVDNGLRKFGLLILACFTLGILVPFVHAVYWLGDEGILLHGAAELASGKKLYSDFWEFYTPMGFLITEGWMFIFGQSFTSLRLFADATISGITCLTYLTCILVSDNFIMPLILVMCWVVVSQSDWTIVSHHWLTTLLSMSAAWFSLLSVRGDSNRLGWPMLAGLAAGTAAMITSSRGILAILATIATFISTRRFSKQLKACLMGCLVIPIVCLAYIVLNGEFTSAYEDIVEFTLYHYTSIQSVPFGWGSSWLNPIKYIFPVAGLLSLLLLAGDTRIVLRDYRFRSCIFFGLAGLVGAYPRPDNVHINFTTPLVLPLISYCASRLTASWRNSYRYTAFALFVLPYGRPAVHFMHSTLTAMHAPVFKTNAGSISLLGDEQNGGEEIFRFIESTPSSDRFLFYPYLPMIPYLTGRQQVSKIDLFTPGYTTKAQYFEACQVTMHEAKWVILDRVWMAPEHWKKVFPAMTNSSPPETRWFEQAIHQNFIFVSRVGNFEV